MIEKLLDHFMGGRKLNGGSRGRVIIMRMSQPPQVTVIKRPDGKVEKRTSSSGVIIKTSNNKVASKLANLYNSYKARFVSTNPGTYSSYMALANNYYS